MTRLGRAAVILVSGCLACSGSDDSEPIPTDLNELVERQSEACHCFHAELGYSSEDACESGYVESYGERAACLEELADGGSPELRDAIECHRVAEMAFVSCVEMLECDDGGGFASCELEALVTLDECPPITEALVEPDGGEWHPCD